MPNEKALSKLALITVLKKCSPDHRIRLINYLNKDGIQVLSETVYNTLFNMPLTPAQKKKIRKNVKIKIAENGSFSRLFQVFILFPLVWK